MDEFDPLTSAERLNEGYELRNQWARGGKRGGGPSKLEGLPWSVLRTSILVFYWLDTHTPLFNEGLPLDNALIDEETRASVNEERSSFDPTEHLVAH